FDIIAFSISFEDDFPAIPAIFALAGAPPLARDRSPSFPLVIAGGAACFLNPEPIAPFIDLFLIGEAEAMVSEFFNIYDPDEDRESLLARLVQNAPGAYAPSFYEPAYSRDGTLESFTPLHGAPASVKRVTAEDISNLPTCSAILSPEASFNQTFLIEVARGCPHGCRFCGAGFIYRPPRFRPRRLLEACMEKGLTMTNRIGLVGAAVSDLPCLQDLCGRFRDENIRVSFSSLRADALTPGMIRTLRQSRVKTATIAPDAGSERMRRVINKGLAREDALRAAEALVEGGVPNLKLYFMVGLPTETEDDVAEIVTLTDEIKERFLSASRTRRRIGGITVSLNPFVPKPFTPFQWAPMDGAAALKKKIKIVKNGLKRTPNVTVHAESPRRSYRQALLSRGDRRVADLLLLAHENKGNWAKTLKQSPVDPDFFARRERPRAELLPWDFIDHGIRKSFLSREYKRALKAKTSSPCPMKDCDICGVCEG
ncbi:MAG: radical SAM protein, partial [Desulfobacterales bacterium]|nr:radical SAM protein [Desulfobacterales bacterium]